MPHENGRWTGIERLTDAELLARQDGDAFTEFYRRHARRLAGYLMRVTGDPDVAADLTAEVFAAALAARRRYRPELAAPSTWLWLVEERPYEEIAGAEGVSEAAIRQRVSRGLAGLRRRIGGQR